MELRRTATLGPTGRAEIPVSAAMHTPEIKTQMRSAKNYARLRLGAPKRSLSPQFRFGGSRMKVRTNSLISLISMVYLGAAACSSGTEEGSSVSGRNDADQGDARNSDQPKKADSDPELEDYPADDIIEAPAGQLLVKVLFHGGAGPKRCLKWTPEVEASDGLKLLKPIRNEKRHGDETKQVDDGKISGSYKTTGGRDGFIPQSAQAGF